MITKPIHSDARGFSLGSLRCVAQGVDVPPAVMV
jgi:hypothetical protein